ncbi:hypothetical protein PG988_000883 [Apiospora saccharicola]
MVNSTGEFSDHHFMVYLRLEDLEHRGDFTRNYIWHRFHMHNFQTAPTCSEPVNMMEKIVRIPYPGNPARSEEELFGMNVTLEVSITDVAGERDENEIVHQHGIQLYGRWCLQPAQWPAVDDGSTSHTQ